MSVIISLVSLSSIWKNSRISKVFKIISLRYHSIAFGQLFTIETPVRDGVAVDVNPLQSGNQPETTKQYLHSWPSCYEKSCDGCRVTIKVVEVALTRSTVAKDPFAGRAGEETMPLGIRPIVDFVFRLLFSERHNADLLIDLLNAILTPKDPIVNFPSMIWMRHRFERQVDLSCGCTSSTRLRISTKPACVACSPIRSSRKQ